MMLVFHGRKLLIPGLDTKIQDFVEQSSGGANVKDDHQTAVFGVTLEISTEICDHIADIVLGAQTDHHILIMGAKAEYVHHFRRRGTKAHGLEIHGDLEVHQRFDQLFALALLDNGQEGHDFFTHLRPPPRRRI